MRSHLPAGIPPRRLAAAAWVSAVVVALAACTSNDEAAHPPPPPTSAAGPAASAPAAGPAPADGVSPGGVTTSVNAPAASTEEQYFQACYAAKVWMEQQGGHPKDQIEPYLATLQSADQAGPGTFGVPWSQLSADAQAAVIVAVQAAADALCG